MAAMAAFPLDALGIGFGKDFHAEPAGADAVGAAVVAVVGKGGVSANEDAPNPDQR